MSNEINLKERLDDFWVYPKLTKIKNSRKFDDNFFSFLNDEDNKDTPTNLYIHIPFCDSGCIFCPYYKIHGKKNYDDNISEYVDTLIKELKMYKNTPFYSKKKIASVHFGGGNPLLMSLDEFRRLVDAIKENFEVETNDNWALEGSINTVKSVEFIKGLIDLGITRMSFGIQTFKESIRKKMNMRASISDLYKGVEILKEAGLKEYCFDMMYNMPDQSEEDLYNDLKMVTELDPYHIDIYNLAIFPNTHLDKLLKKTDYFGIIPTNESNVKMYRLAHKWLLDNGYRQIITNTYSKKQKDVHIGDKLYLKNNNVLGIGASSRGYIDGYSYKNTCTLDEYMTQVNLGNFPADLGYKSSDEEHSDRTMVFFPINLSIKKDDIDNYARYEGKINEIVENGLAKWNSEVLELTEEGIVWSGNISAFFIAEENWNTYIKSFFNSLKEKTNPYNEDKMGSFEVKLEEV